MTLAAVVDPRGGHLDPPGRRGDLAWPVMTVADHLAAASLITLAGMRLEVGAAFSLERDREHLAGGQTAQLVQIHRPAVRSLGCGVRVLVGVIY